MLVFISLIFFFVVLLIISKKKIKKNTIEIKKNIIEIKKNENSEYKNKLNIKAIKQDENELLFPIFCGLNNIKDLHEATHLTTIEKALKEVRESIVILKSISDLPNYKDLIKKTKAQYREQNKPETIKNYQSSFINSPSDFDVENYTRQKYIELVNNFISYWDIQISNLKMKSAIIKRRIYLVEQSDLMIFILKGYCFDDLVIKMEEYKKKQLINVH